MNFKKIVILSLFLIFNTIAFAEIKIDIWEGVDTMKGEHTKMIVYPANVSNNTHTAVIVCPGGSYAHLCGLPAEGKKPGEWFSEHGITAFVLCYRTAGRGYHYPAMIEDFQRAIQLIRENSEKYDIDPNKIGAIGFSAGGHLVTMCNEYSNENHLKSLGINTSCSLQPDWVAAIYPVVSMQDSIAHHWSRKSLLGKNYTKAAQDKFSLEMNVNKSMSPMFVQASDDDHKVDVKNSIALVNSLNDNNILCQFEHLSYGGHGYGMKNNKFARESKWQEKLYNWLFEINILTKKD